MREPKKTPKRRRRKKYNRNNKFPKSSTFSMISWKQQRVTYETEWMNLDPTLYPNTNHFVWCVQRQQHSQKQNTFKNQKQSPWFLPSFTGGKIRNSSKLPPLMCLPWLKFLSLSTSSITNKNSRNNSLNFWRNITLQK